MSNIFETDQNSLQHFGVKGMKWGVRRFEDRSGHLTAAGKARYDDGAVSKKIQANTPKAKSDSTEQPAKKIDKKKVIGAGMVVVGTALAAYGGYKLYQMNQQNKSTKEAINNATKALNEFKSLQTNMSRPNPINPVPSSKPKVERSTVSHTPIDRVQIDRATVDRIKVDRTPIDMDSFNKAAQANDDLVNDLLKKNAKALGL